MIVFTFNSDFQIILKVCSCALALYGCRTLAQLRAKISIRQIKIDAPVVHNGEHPTFFTLPTG
jgi:hypothetical protein